jgi:hypothetical protein
MPSSSSSLSYDFDAFEEIQIQTGGSDASVQTGGVSVNLATKSGGNAFRGTARYLFVDDSLSANNITDELREQGAGFGYQVDARLERRFRVRNATVSPALDVFNVLNANTVLDRVERQNPVFANDAQEILAPRVGRVGVRFTF